MRRRCCRITASWRATCCATRSSTEAEFNVVSVRDGLYYSRVSYDGRDINYEMVRDGCAWYDKANAPGETALEKAQDEAQRAKQGLWSVKSPTPPWVFRSRNR